MATIKEEQQARERAFERRRKIEKTDAELKIARSRLVVLEAQVTEPDTASAAIQEIIALSDRVPDGILSRGDGVFAPGGYQVRPLLRRLATDALGEVERKRQRQEADLPIARQRVAELEAALERLTTHPVHAGDVRLKVPEMTARGTVSTR